MGLFTSFQLKSRDAETRRRAALSIAVKGKTSAIASLQPLLDDPEWRVRQAAIEALGTIGDAAAAPLVLAAVKQADQLRDEAGANALRSAAVEALGRIGVGGTGALIDALHDRQARLRETAIAALGAVGGEQAVAALADTLNDDRSSVRQAGAAAIVRAGGPSAVPTLLRALGHKDPMTRKAAAAALGGIGSPEIVEPLRRAMGDREKPVREAAVDALASIGGRAAVGALVGAVAAADRELKGLIADRLKTITWTPATPQEQIVHAALLGRFDEAAAGGAAALDALTAVLSDRDAGRRRGAAEALGRVADPRAAAALVGLFRDADAGVRDAAVEAIAAIGLPAAGAVTDALGDRAATTRAATAAALAKIGEARVAAALVTRLAAGSAARHAGRELRVVPARDDLDAARQTADALERLLDHAARLLPPDLLRRCSELPDVILLEPGQAPGESDTLDLQPQRDQAAAELARR